MLFRFREAQAADLGIIDAGRTRRPKIITEVESIPSCEKWRGQTLKEISRKVSKIQDPSLSDYQIRDLNDEINKLMREKHMWEVQIRNLGGPNYTRGGGKIYDESGKEIPGAGKGYRYFGRARELIRICSGVSLGWSAIDIRRLHVSSAPQAIMNNVFSNGSLEDVLVFQFSCLKPPGKILQC